MTLLADRHQNALLFSINPAGLPSGSLGFSLSTDDPATFAFPPDLPEANPAEKQ